MPHSITDRCNAMILNSEHSAHLLNSQSFLEALAHLEQIAEGLCVLKNKQESNKIIYIKQIFIPNILLLLIYIQNKK